MSRKSALIRLLRGKSIPVEAPYSLDDLILESMGRSIGSLVAMHEASGYPISAVRLSDDVTVEIDPSAMGSVTNWKSRLRKLRKAAQSIAPDVGVSDLLVTRKVMEADGWSLNRHTLKTPVWMRPHVEVSVRSLLEEGFEWIGEIQDRRQD